MNKLRIGVVLAVLCALLSGAALAEIPPAPTGTAQTYVFDLTGSGVMAEADIRAMTAYARDLESKTGVQAVTVLVDFLDGEDVDMYAHDLFTSWGIGSKKDNNGVLLLFSRGDRDICIYSGTGVEHTLNASARQRVVDQYADLLTAGQYSEGLRNMLFAISDRIAQSQGVSLTAGTAGNYGGVNTGNSFTINGTDVGGFFSSLFGGLFDSGSNYHYEYDSNGNEYQYEYDANQSTATPKKEGGSWLGTLILIIIVISVLRRSGRRSSSSGCLPFLLGGFLGNMMRGNSRTTRMPPMGGWGGFGGPRSGGFGGGSSGGFGGFKPGGGTGRGASTSRKF